MRCNYNFSAVLTKQTIDRLTDVVFFSMIASLTLHLHFLSENHDLWLLVALSFWWYLIERKNLSIPEVLLGSFVLSIPFSNIIFQSVFYSHPTAVFFGTLMNVPQIVLPSLLYLHYKKRRGFVYGFTGMLFAWLLIAELRASPQLSNIFAVESSLPLSLSVNSLLHLSSLPTAVTLFILFAGSLSLLHFIFARHLLTLVISGVAVLVLGIPIKAASHSASATDVKSASTILQTGFSNLETVSDRFQLEVGNAVEYILGTLIQQVTPAAELLLLPETVIRTTEGTRMLQDITRGHPTTIIGGAFMTTDPTSAKGFNSAILVNNGEATEIFHKWQLIPFYESSVFHRGDFMATVAFGETRVLGILICMDATFTALAEQAIAAGATELVVLSASDYGFGYSTPSLQLSIAKRLARRHSIPLLLAATNGPSAFIDAFGNVDAAIGEGRQAIVNTGSDSDQHNKSRPHSVKPKERSTWPDISLCFIFLGFLLVRQRANRRPQWFSIFWKE